jgi:hypothetical protein
VYLVRNKSTGRWIAGLLLTSFVFAGANADPKDTPLVRGIYEAPLPPDPMALWDRVGDLRWLRRTADSKVLEGYLERTAVSLVLGEPIQTAPTLEQLLQRERSAPPPDPAKISRVLGMFGVVLEGSADESSVPKDYRGQVQYRYEGHSVWSHVRDTREAYLRVQFTNHSPYDVASLVATIRIATGSETLEFPCTAEVSTVLRTGASAPGMCRTVQVRSSAKPGVGTLIDTAALLEWVKLIEHGAATFTAAVGVSLPQLSVSVSAAGVQPFNPSMRPRTFPILMNITCNDRDTCAEERSAAREHMLYSPFVLGLIILLAGSATGYGLMRASLWMGGGARALPLARLTGGLVVLCCFGIAVWNWHALETTHDGESMGGYLYFFLMLAAGVFGLGVLIATLIVRSKHRQPK